MPRPKRILESAPLSFAAALVVLIAVQATRQFADADLWGRLASAAIWLGTGRFPYHDTLSFTARLRPWIDHEWLSGLVFFGVLRGFGETGLLLLKDFSLALTMAAVFLLHARVYKVTSAYAFFGFLATLPFTTLGYKACVRCQIFSFLLFLIFLHLLEAIRAGTSRPRALAWFVPLGILWANLHAGFILGIFALAAYGIGAALAKRSIKALLPHAGAALAIVTGTAFLNPYGSSYLEFLVRAWTMDRSDIIEWAPLWPIALGQWEIWALIMMSLAALGLGLGRRDRNKWFLFSPSAFLLLLVAMTIRAYRFQTFLALGLVALFPAFVPADRFTFLPEEVARRIFHSFVAASLVFGLASLASPESHPLRAPLPAVVFPVEAVRYLREAGASGNIATPLFAGEFTAWALYPRMHVALDGRFEEVYRLEEARNWFRFFRTPVDGAWPRSQGADWVVTPANAVKTDEALETSGLWKIADRNGEFTLWRAGREAPVKEAGDARESSIADFFRPEDWKRFGSN